MILSIIVIAVLGVVAFFHYTQGLFNSTVSLVAAAVATFVAFGFHESLLRTIGPDLLGAYGDAVALTALFAVTYALLRAFLDSFLPSNVRYPVVFDKAGAAVAGLIVGFFASGIVATMAQMLPFGGAMLMHEPYEMADYEFPADRRLAGSLYRVKRDDPSDIPMTTVVADRIGGPDAVTTRTSLWLPVDQWLAGLVGRVSNDMGGSLSGTSDFGRIYPEGGGGFVDALYGRRVGIESAAKRYAVNFGERVDVRLGDRGGLFAMTFGENSQFGDDIPTAAGDDWFRERKIEPTYRPAADVTPIVVRLMFGEDAGTDGLVRFGPANARLAIGGKQMFPIGTLDSSRILVLASPDDRLLASTGVDLVYEVPTNLLDGQSMPDGAFLEFKELARLPLGGQRIYQYVTQDGRTQVLRKETTKRRLDDALTGVDGGDDLGRGTEAFDMLRMGLTMDPADPAEAELAAQEGRDPEATAGAAASDADAGSSNTPAEEPLDEEGGGNPMDVLRGEAAERNRAIEGDE